ncbi:aggregation-promoting factor [Bombilactobacillus apium]|uniref:aggregation-promoting factor n=1 Tax=Bombilactobacillus apium TaxID=2675299 RepID=UPI0018929D30|nr:LysM peptidoglycan-binding domain-containing protein [Bombilactobacillus apium]
MKIKQVAFATILGLISFLGATKVANADSIYTVKSGDTLSEILMQTQNDLSKLNQVATDNNIQNVDLIFPGQKLIFKDNGQVSVATKTQVQKTPEVATVQQAVAQEDQQPAASQAKQEAPVQQQAAPATQTPAPVQQQAAPAVTVSGDEDSAREWIAGRESGGNYGAANGSYVGKYQLSSSYLNGDYSAANQDRVANQYVQSRYGSWQNAKKFWLQNNWY